MVNFDLELNVIMVQSLIISVFHTGGGGGGGGRGNPPNNPLLCGVCAHIIIISTLIIQGTCTLLNDVSTFGMLEMFPPPNEKSPVYIKLSKD